MSGVDFGRSTSGRDRSTGISQERHHPRGSHPGVMPEAYRRHLHRDPHLHVTRQVPHAGSAMLSQRTRRPTTAVARHRPPRHIGVSLTWAAIARFSVQHVDVALASHCLRGVDRPVLGQVVHDSAQGPVLSQQGVSQVEGAVTETADARADGCRS